MNEKHLQAAITWLNQVWTRLNGEGFNTDVKPSINAQADVLRQFQPILGKANLGNLMETDFRSFLKFKNNRHWTSLERQGSRICRDMPGLRQALMVLQDESRPIAARYDYVVNNVKYMGPAITTPILLVLFPSKYGVWNKTSEAGLRLLGLWPTLRRGESNGNCYAAMNQTFLRLGEELGLDLWTLDILWHYLKEDESERNPG